MSHVLLVDDDTWASDQYAEWCHQEGWQVSRAEHGLSAIEAINTKLPSAIVLDVFLPGANGLALLHELQSYPDTSSVPVVLCTASAKELEGVDMTTYGVRHILDKISLTRHEFTRTLRKVLL